MAAFRALFLAVAVLACLLGVGVGAAAEPRYRTYLTAHSEEEIPLAEAQRYFDCSDTIYLVLEANGLNPKPHVLETVWDDPEGRTRETTRYTFHANGGYARVWSWLRLHGPGGVAASVGRAFDPSLGMEAFIGVWSVEVSVDDRKIAEHEFEVLC